MKIFRFISILLIFTSGCNVSKGVSKEEKEEINIYTIEVGYEVDERASEADKFIAEAEAVVGADRTRALACVKTTVYAYEKIVQYLENQPIPKTKRVKYIHAAHIDLMKKRLELVKVFEDIWSTYYWYSHKEPSREQLEKGENIKSDVLLKEGNT